MEVHIAPIRETDPKLAALPRRGWRSNKAWARLRRATPLLLEGQGSVMCFVDSGGWPKAGQPGIAPGARIEVAGPGQKDVEVTGMGF
jgi:hypothetical protein